MSTESLYATQTRIYKETGIGTGVPTGDVFQTDMVSAAAKHEHLVTNNSKDPFRQPREKEPIHTRYLLRTSHCVNPAFAGWLIRQHCVNGMQMRVIDAPEPSFVMQYLLEDGDLVEFRGVHLAELQLSATESRTATMECSWVATRRELPGGGLTPELGSLGLTRHVSSLESAAALQAGALDPTDPRTVNAIPIHAAEFMMKRSTEPALFSPYGRAQRVLCGPWTANAEIRLPANSDSEAAHNIQSGAFGLWLGPDGNDLGITSDTATQLTPSEPLQGEGFREHSIAIEFRTGASGEIFRIADDT